MLTAPKNKRTFVAFLSCRRENIQCYVQAWVRNVCGFYHSFIYEALTEIVAWDTLGANPHQVQPHAVARLSHLPDADPPPLSWLSLNPPSSTQTHVQNTKSKRQHWHIRCLLSLMLLCTTNKSFYKNITFSSLGNLSSILKIIFKTATCT